MSITRHKRGSVADTLCLVVGVGNAERNNWEQIMACPFNILQMKGGAE